MFVQTKGYASSPRGAVFGFFVFVLGIITLALFAFAGTAKAATAPSLGTADTFSVLSSTFTPSAGTTAIEGDLGYTTLSAGTFTVSGSTHTDVSGTPAGAMYQQAGLDQSAALNNAINGLNTQTCTPIDGTLNGVVIGTNNPGTFPPRLLFRCWCNEYNNRHDSNS